jgi:Holliday junction resolvase-like predicted endonuclease
VGLRKRRQVGRAAVQYLQRRRLRDVPVRFDVVGITWPTAGGEPTVTHFPDAFPADLKWSI